MIDQNKKKVELLTPLKNTKSLTAVLENADAVYFGVESLNMRQFSDNFKLDELNNIVKKCHDNNIKAYLTTNIIIYENELASLERVLDKAVEAEIDSVIVHDIGAIQLVKDRGLDFHISTQANISNSQTAKFYEDLDASRLILARELSLKQIKEIKTSLKKAKIETFIHGAQCTSVSGRCYFSAEVCGSQDYSANRGKCIQPCRRKWRVIDDNNNELLYDGFFFINTKDLCMIEYIPEMIDAGIDVFKIEGRMRDPIYIEETTACYREAIEANYNNSITKNKIQDWLNRLKKVYNRGFSTGFYFNLPKGSEIQREIDGNISNHKKVEIGKIINYFSDKKAAKILLTKGKVKLGDELFIIGTHTETFLRQEVNSLQIKQKKNLTETPFVSSTNNRITIGIIVDKPVKKNDKVFKLESLLKEDIKL
ncbi:MAG: U32 family peptidase [Candidatus Lokiarchaeota archaeon]|nr:U32 family peptidase [Candidatus Lokiarchaeota archaeon]